MIEVTPTAHPEVLLVAPRVHRDGRGFFVESFNARDLAAAGIEARFVQDNHSGSARGVLRGLHYQIRHAQGKLVRVLAGEIYDVAVDLRRSSPRFAQWVGLRLTARDFRSLWVPPGFAHGFLVVSDFAEVMYKTTEYYAPLEERCVRYDDPGLGIEWPLDGEPTLAPRDRDAVGLEDAETYP